MLMVIFPPFVLGGIVDKSKPQAPETPKPATRGKDL